MSARLAARTCRRTARTMQRPAAACFLQDGFPVRAVDMTQLSHANRTRLNAVSMGCARDTTGDDALVDSQGHRPSVTFTIPAPFEILGKRFRIGNRIWNVILILEMEVARPRAEPHQPDFGRLPARNVQANALRRITQRQQVDLGTPDVEISLSRYRLTSLFNSDEQFGHVIAGDDGTREEESANHPSNHPPPANAAIHSPFPLT